MPGSGVFLSEADLQDLTHAAEVLHDPFGFGTLDGWRWAVNECLVRIVRAEVAIFFLMPGVEGGRGEREPIFSAELSGDQRADFVRYALHDAGSDRAMAFGLAAATQRAVIGDAWEAYKADPSVIAFYEPNRLMDGTGLMLWDRNGRKEASIEMHREQFGSPLFGQEGAARLALLLPAFRAGVAAVRASEASLRGVGALLDTLGQSIALADAQGHLLSRSSALSSIVDSDPDGARIWAALTQLGATQSALFEARGWGHRHRATLPSLEAALTATDTVETRVGRYLLSAIEAPTGLLGGRHGFLLRVEPMFAPALTPAAAQARFGLTPRELQVARLVASGSRNAAVAGALAISPHTARRHTEKVLTKLGVKSRAAVGPVLRGERSPTEDSH